MTLIIARQQNNSNDLNVRITEYAKTRRLKSAPNIIKVFFRYHTDHVIEKINDELENVIEDLGNTRNKSHHGRIK